MTNRLAPIAALLTGTFIFLLGNGLLGTLLSLRLNLAGQPTEVAGIVGSLLLAMLSLNDLAL